MDKKEIARRLDEIAVLLELKGENPFKCNAYRNAARKVESLEKPLEYFKTIRDVQELKGVGSSLAEKILTLIQKGELPYYHILKAAIPPGLIQMLEIPGFGPKKARAVYEKLGISTVGELEYACRENRLLDLPGFGAKTQDNILRGIDYLKKARGRFHLFEARLVAEELVEALSPVSGVKQIEIAGSLRRFREIVKDIDLLVSASDSTPVMEAFANHPLVDVVLSVGKTKSSVRLHTGIQVDLRVVSREQFPFALPYFTGSKEHNTALRGRALKLGYKLNEYGLFRRNSGKSKLIKNEEEVFQQLGLCYIPPELREDRGEIEAAESGTLPRLVSYEDLKGILHIHTPYSDGIATISDYITDAQKRGWSYLGISDHSQSAYYANGLSIEKIERQHAEIDGLNKRLKGFRIFKGIESDILADGSLDYPDEILARFDFIIASVHSKFKLPESEMTKRIIRAMENPYTTMLGHPTGRLLLAREGYRVDMDAIIAAAAENQVIIELNANPFRLDIDWRHVKKAISAGVLISINPDAHRLENTEYARLGVDMARKGWCEPAHIFNTRSASEIESYLKTKHHKSNNISQK